MTKHHITKKVDTRYLNPLEPKYTYPGDKETRAQFETF